MGILSFLAGRYIQPEPELKEVVKIEYRDREVVKYVDRVVKEKTRKVKPDGTIIERERDTTQNTKEEKTENTRTEESVVSRAAPSRYSLGLAIIPSLEPKNIMDFREQTFRFDAGVRLGNLPLFLTTGFDTNLRSFDRFSLGLRVEF